MKICKNAKNSNPNTNEMQITSIKIRDITLAYTKELCKF